MHVGTASDLPQIVSITQRWIIESSSDGAMTTHVEERVRQLNSDCEAAIREHRWDDGLAGFQQLMPLLNELGDRRAVPRVHLRMGQLFEETNRRDHAREHYRQAEKLASECNDIPLRAAALHRMGHLVRITDPQQARALFQQSLDLQSNDDEGNALSLAMIGQIDFTEGDQLGGLDTMLTALNRMPANALSYDHLVEHIAYFGGKLNRADYIRIVSRRIAESDLRNRLFQLTSSPHAG